MGFLHNLHSLCVDFPGAQFVVLSGAFATSPSQLCGLHLVVAFWMLDQVMFGVFPLSFFGLDLLAGQPSCEVEGGSHAEPRWTLGPSGSHLSPGSFSDKRISFLHPKPPFLSHYGGGDD